MLTARFDDRVQQIRAAMRDQQLDALLTFDPQETYYITGFTPVIYSHPIAAVIPLEGEPALVIWANRGPSARASAQVESVYTYGRWAGEIGAADVPSALASALQDLKVENGSIGYDPSTTLVEHLEFLRSAASDAKLTPVSNVIDRVRGIKQPHELAAARDAAELARVGMAAAQEEVAKRTTEVDVSVAAMSAMQHHWSEHLHSRQSWSFGSSQVGAFNALWAYCLTGERVALNSAPPTKSPIRDGELCWVVVVAVLDGMHIELERTFAVGELPAERDNAFRALVEINEQGRDTLAPGISGAEVYERLAGLYRDNGYGDYLPGRIGHGVGLGHHEWPSLGPKDTDVLESQMLVTYEPNLRIPSFGGLQHSDTVLITESGFEFLTDYPRDYLRV